MNERQTNRLVSHLPGEYPRRLPAGDGERFPWRRCGGAGDLLCCPGAPPPPLL